ncbi:MAG: sulfite exporter TauE/SafE family protein [Myxococcota bacterium]
MINTLAGGGSLLTLPALIFAGLPADVANGTNRVGVFVQCTASVATFHRAGRMPWKTVPRFLLPTVVGAVVGTLLALRLDADAMKPAIGLVLLAALPTLFIRPPAETGRRRNLLGSAALFLAGAYGGFVQAGVGILLVLVLVGLSGLRLQPGNAVKLVLVGAFTLPALLLFTAFGLVDWVPGCALALGNMSGGILGSRLSLSIPDRAVRAIVAVMVAVSATRLLDVW